MPLRHLRSDEANQAVGMLQMGIRQVEVAERFGVSQSVISRLWNRHRTTGSVHRRRGQGRRRCTTVRDDRFLTLNARRNPTITATALLRELQNASEARPSIRTVRNRLHEVGLRSRRPLRRVPLTLEHKQNRLAWAQQRENWGNEWWTTLYSDESRFGLHSDSRQVRVWRTRDTPRHRSFVQEIYPYNGGSVMVWGGIAIGRRTPLYICNRNMNSIVYQNDIINNIIVPLARTIGPDFQFLDDNARPHRAQIVMQAIEEGEIQHLPLPARSPDLNPVEHVWDMLTRALDNHRPAPLTLRELRTVLPQLWDDLPQDDIDHLILSMPRRVHAVIQARGGHTRY